MNILLQQLKENPFLLAPMAGITDVAFRSFMKDMGCSIVITELVSATGLKYNSRKTIDLMRFSQNQHPIGIQIFGDNLEDLAFAASTVEDSGADFVDLNFGCPVPKVVKKGGGAAMLKDLKKVEQVFQTVKAATTLPVTVKIRTGWDDISRNAIELSHIAYNEGLTWVAIHGRTRSQAYKGMADWDYIAHVKSYSKIPIIGNGDICTAKQAVDNLLNTQCDGVMIGRGCLKNPWLFIESLDLLNSKQRDFRNLDSPTFNFESVFQSLDKSYSTYATERVRNLQLKKLSSWFSAGLPESSQFRKNIFQAESHAEITEQITSFFKPYNNLSIKSFNNDGFLMGGHG
ncbi:MAG: tRNA dihydrouridine synthase DusB [Bdellovibrionales bacterium]|nr:tRNA dihydrouridine synthase DusB [Bdellovibrionales bacterium]